MQIDLRKLIAILLPICIKRDVLVEMLRVLSSPFLEVYNQYSYQARGWRYRINSDVSILSLKQTIKRELDIDVSIKELDGKSTDFLVTAIGKADNDRLRSVIQANKPAGKSFIFQTGNDTFEVMFTEYVCETVFTENKIVVRVVGGYVWATSESNVFVDIQVEITAYSYSYQKKYTVTIPSGWSESDHVEVFLGPQNGNPPAFQVMTAAAITGVSPDRDTFNKYVYSEEPVSVWDN